MEGDKAESYGLKSEQISLRFRKIFFIQKLQLCFLKLVVSDWQFIHEGHRGLAGNSQTVFPFLPVISCPKIMFPSGSF